VGPWPDLYYRLSLIWLAMIAAGFALVFFEFSEAAAIV
jgi:hypothetical protein